MDLKELRCQAAALRKQGHWAFVDEKYDQNGKLIEAALEHYPMCFQCLKEKKDGTLGKVQGKV